MCACPWFHQAATSAGGGGPSGSHGKITAQRVVCLDRQLPHPGSTAPVSGQILEGKPLGAKESGDAHEHLAGSEKTCSWKHRRLFAFCLTAELFCLFNVTFTDPPHDKLLWDCTLRSHGQGSATTGVPGDGMLPRARGRSQSEGSSRVSDLTRGHCNGPSSTC